MEEEPQGKTDLLSVAYIVGGLPGIVAFLAASFWFARSCGFPA